MLGKSTLEGGGYSQGNASELWPLLLVRTWLTGSNLCSVGTSFNYNESSSRNCSCPHYGKSWAQKLSRILLVPNRGSRNAKNQLYLLLPAFTCISVGFVLQQGSCNDSLQVLYAQGLIVIWPRPRGCPWRQLGSCSKWKMTRLPSGWAEEKRIWAVHIAFLRCPHGVLDLQIVLCSALPPMRDEINSCS